MCVSDKMLSITTKFKYLNGIHLCFYSLPFLLDSCSIIMSLAGESASELDSCFISLSCDAFLYNQSLIDVWHFTA